MSLKKTLVCILILWLCSVLVVQTANAQTNPLVIIDDDMTFDSFNPYNWGESDETYSVYGENSLKLVIPSASQYQSFYFDFHEDLTAYDTLGIWFKGNNSGNTLRFSLITVLGYDIFYTFYVDVSQAWEFIEINLSTMGVVGTPNIDNINYFEMSVSNSPGSEFTVYWDYTFVSYGPVYSTPTPTPTATPGPVEFDLDLWLFGDLAIFGILGFIILGLLAIKLSNYAGVFVGIIAILYEIMLFEGLNVYGNNIWYMIIVLFFALFAFLMVFHKD